MHRASISSLLMQVVSPSESYMPSYIAALEQGWSSDTVRGAVAAREELQQIAADRRGFLSQMVDREAKGQPVTLPDGSKVPRLPGYKRWLWDGEFCGSIGFRWQPGTTELPPHCLGHIGYVVVPWKRGKGYATRALNQFLLEVRSEALPFVVITTDTTNVASRRVIEANGGVLVEQFVKPPQHGGTDALRFRIKFFLNATMTDKHSAWPELPLAAWSDTYKTLHLWLQMVGKVRLVGSAWVNHSWHVTLYVTARGLTTSPISAGMRTFQIEFDFIDHRLSIQTSDGRIGAFALEPQTVAAFYSRLMNEMEKLDVKLRIHPLPNEIENPIRFDQDEEHRAYDAEYANRFWRVLVQADRVFKQFRARFIGKVSPVHFFWGAPDLAVTRFSGRRAPSHPGGVPHLPDWVTREAYSHEVSSCGFWPGGGAIAYPAFYSYAYPEPAGFARASVKPASAFYSNDLHEFVLPYDIVRQSQSPDDTLLQFLQTTYEAAANLAKWDRPSLERYNSANAASIKRET